MRASSPGNPYRDERGRFASANAHATKVINSDEHYQNKTKQREQEVRKFKTKAHQKPSKEFHKNKVRKIDDFSIKRMSKHVKKDRKERTDFALNLISEENATIKDRFLIERPDGREEIHIMYSNAIIKVAAPDGTWVTTLIARPYQVKRYYSAMGESAPKEMLDAAVDHTVKKYFLVGLK